MLNFGDKIAFYSSISFTVVAMLAMIYALWTYHWRARSIRQRGQAGFDDKVGPTVLTVALLIAILINFVFRIVEDEDSGKKH